MEQKKKLKLFISYSHKDELSYIEEFKQHITPLKINGLIEDVPRPTVFLGTDLG